jgi:ATP-dependent 26S proteasome regulatory subunit
MCRVSTQLNQSTNPSTQPIKPSEVDALASSRESGDMHEATRRLLSVILQRVEGLEGHSDATLICATNRPQVRSSSIHVEVAVVRRCFLSLPNTSSFTSPLLFAFVCVHVPSISTSLSS